MRTDPPTAGRDRRVPPPRLLTIAGSDSGGGAGIQADLKTFAAHGSYGMSAVTAVTAQNTRAVTAVHELPPEVVAAQIDAVFEDLGVDGVKIGMLASGAIVLAVAASLRRHLPETGGPPVVLDPVMVAKSGASLLADDAVEALAEELLPLATLVTPNLPEAERLTGLSTEGQDARREEAARELSRMAAGPSRRASGPRTAAGAGRSRHPRGPAVLLKGGHGEGDEVVDLLYEPRTGFTRFVHPRVDTRSTHGTGCTLSSAVAARLAAGEPLARAVEGGIDYLQGAMAAAYPLGGGHGPVDHLYRLVVRTPPEPVEAPR